MLYIFIFIAHELLLSSLKIHKLATGVFFYKLVNIF